MNGFSLTLIVPLPERDEVIADLWEAGTTGITEDNDWLRAFFDPDANAEALARQFGRFEPRVEAQDDTDWVEQAHSMWKPFAVGERFYLVPEWQNDPAPCGRVRLRIRPGLACGSGAHPATQLCLQGLERTGVEDAAVLDVGTGSGILAEAARLLGAARVLACDIDHEATVIAKVNTSRMQSPPGFFTGSLRSVRDASVDVVVANLNRATLAMLGRDLTRVARRTIIVSGFREDESAAVERSVGRSVTGWLEQDDWACLLFSVSPDDGSQKR